MPTLSLLDNPAPIHPDAPRSVRAPGGYEWWFFETHDPVADVRVTAMLFDGNPFHAGYVRRYAWYRRFPTRLAPPVPADCPGVLVRVYDKGKLVTGRMRQDGPSACRATDAGVSIGPDGFTRGADGALRLTIRGVFDLTFRPKGPSTPSLLAIAPGATVAGPHGWVVSNPTCGVSGEVTLNGRPVRFDGTGYQDHRFGLEPVALVARRWFLAYAWLDDRPLVVAEFVPRRGPATGVRLLDSAAPGSATWDGRTGLRIPYPTMVDFGEALRLDEPRVIDTTPPFVQLRYRARVGNVTTAALAHVVEPGRAKVPFLGHYFATQRLAGRTEPA